MELRSQFECERYSRIIDECNDVKALQTQCKALIQLYYTQREVTAQLLFNKGDDVKTL